MNLSEFLPFAVGTTIVLFLIVGERSPHMKTSLSHLVLTTAVILGSILLTSCYTELALNNDEPDAAVDTQATEIIEPPPTAVIVEPVYVPIRPPVFRPPVAATPAPGVATQPSPQPSHRDIGNQRTGSSSAQEGPGTVRTSGSTRGGR